MQGEGGGRADDGGWQLKACEPERQEVQFREDDPLGDCASSKHLLSTCRMYSADIGAGGNTKEAKHQARTRCSERKQRWTQGSSAIETRGATPLKPWAVPDPVASLVSFLFSSLAVFSLSPPFLAEVFLGSG